MPKNKIPGAKYLLENFDVTEVSIVVSPFEPCMPVAIVEVAKSKQVYTPEKQLVAKASLPEEKIKGNQKIETRFMILKADDEKQEVYGYAYVPNKADLESDAMTPDELEKAAKSLLINMGQGKQSGTGAGVNHEDFKDIGSVIESAIDTDGSLGKARKFATPISGAWFIGFKLSEKTWKLYKEGKVTGFSIAGYADRVPIETETEDKNILAKALEAIRGRTAKKDDFATYYTASEVSGKVDEMVWVLADSVFFTLWNEDVTDKRASITESILQFHKAVMAIMNNLPDFDLQGSIDQIQEQISSATKTLSDSSSNINGLLETLKSIQKGEEEMTPEELKKAIGEALEPVQEKIKSQGEKLEEVTKKVAEIEKPAEPPEKKAEEKDTQAEILEAIKSMKTEFTGELKAVKEDIEKIKTMPLLKRGEGEAVGGDHRKLADGRVVDKDGKHNFHAMAEDMKAGTAE